MFVTVRKYTGTGDTNEVRKLVEEKLVPALKDAPGFCSYLGAKIDNETMMGISVFGSKEQADSANQRVREIIGKEMAKLLPNAPEITIGEVLLETSRASAS